MSFTFDNALNDDVSLVRFHVGDTDSDGYFLHNETIQYWVDQDNVASAVIACIRYILSQLSKPDFKLDWLSVSGMKEARAGYEALLVQKQVELGEIYITATSTISMPYRSDSYQDSSDADYNDEFDDD